jgi:hypothetical protein
MSLNFRKAQEQAGLVFTKRALHGVRARVGLAIDASGSMQELYRSGTVQATTERLLAVAERLDSDGSMDMWCFDESCMVLPPVTTARFEGYMDTHVLSRGDIWGTTRYAPPLRAAHEHWFAASRPGFMAALFGRRPAAAPGEPALLIFITDGENDPSDRTEAARAMERIAAVPLYIAFVGIGPQEFRFVDAVARQYANVGFLRIPDLARVDTESLLDQLVSEELSHWLKRPA